MFNAILEYEKRLLGQTPEAQGVPVQTRTITATPVDMGPAPVGQGTDPLAAEVKSTFQAAQDENNAAVAAVQQAQSILDEAKRLRRADPVSMDLEEEGSTLPSAKTVQKQTQKAVQAAPDPEEMEELALKEEKKNTAEARKRADELRTMALLVRSMDKFSSTLSKTPMDETRFKTFMDAADRQEGQAKSDTELDLRMRTLGAKRYETKKKAEREAALNDAGSSLSKARQDEIINNGSWQDLGFKSPEDVRKSSANAIDRMFTDQGKLAPIKAAGITAGKVERQVGQEDQDLAFYGDKLTAMGEKNLPGTAESRRKLYEQKVEAIAKKQGAAAAAAKAEKAKIKALSGPVRNYADERFPNEQYQRAIEEAIALQGTGKVLEGDLIDYMILDDKSKLSKVADFLGARGFIVNEYTTPEQKQFADLIYRVGLAKAAANNPGRAPSDADVDNAFKELGLDPAAGPGVNLPKLEAALEQARIQREQIEAKWGVDPEIRETYEKQIGRVKSQSTGPSPKDKLDAVQGRGKPKPNSSPQKPTGKKVISKQYFPKVNKTKVKYEDGTEGAEDGNTTGK